MERMLEVETVKCKLEITEEPTLEHRFRYETDKGSHGSLMGRNNNSFNKSFPKIKIHEYFGIVKIVISLWAVNIGKDKKKTYLPHVHKLKGHNCNQEGKCIIEDKEVRGTEEIELKDIHIVNIKKSDIQKVLKHQYEKNKKNIDGISRELTQTEKHQLDEKSKNDARILEEEFHTVSLRIDVYDANNKPLCEGVFSKLIHHQKTPLKITRISKCSGLAKGGDDIFLFCEEIDANHIQVRFFEENGNWQAYGEFSEKDVHHKVAMVVKTPPYKNKNLDVEVPVKFELVRQYKEGECCTSDAFLFTYNDPDIMEIKRKRQRKTAENMNELQNLVPPYLADLTLSTADFNFGNLCEAQSDDKLPQELPQRGADVGPPSFSGLIPRSGINSSNNDDERIMEIYDDVESDSSEFSEKETNNFDLLHNIILHFFNFLRNNLNSCEMKNLLVTYGNAIEQCIALTDKDGYNVIHTAVIQSRPINIALLRLMKIAETSKDNPLNKFNNNSQTPLHLAVLVDSASLVKLLICHGADPNISDLHGNTAMHLACYYGSEIIEILLDDSNYQKKDYHKNKPKINEFNNDGYSPLHLAVLSDVPTAVKKLCISGANINLSEKKNGKTAVHLAVEKLHVEVLKQLLKFKTVEVNKQMHNGNSPLHLACLLESFEAVSLLMEAGANPYMEHEFNSNNVHRNDCFDLASNNPRILNLLLEKISSRQDKKCGEQVNPYLKVDSNSLKSSIFNGKYLNRFHAKQTRCYELNSNCSKSINSIPGKVTEIDDETKGKLVSLLDASTEKNWESLMNVLNYDFMHSILKKSVNPILALFNCIEDIAELREGLECLDFQEALDVIDEYLNASGNLSRLKT